LRVFYKLFLLLLLLEGAFSQNYGWITPNKTYLKFSIIDDGIYRINKSDFTQAGIIVNFDPRSVKVYYKGSQVPIYFEGENDGTFDDADFFDLYASRNYGGLTKTYKENLGNTVVDYITDEYYNLYSDTNTYWVGWDGNNGLRFPSSPLISNTDYPFNYYFDRLHFEKDSTYSTGETFNAFFDFRYFNNEKVSGEGWYWKELGNGGLISPNFSLPENPLQNIQCGFKVFAYPNSRDTNYNEHRVILKINSTVVSTLFTNDYKKIDTTIPFSSSFFTSGINSISFTYAPFFTNTELVPRMFMDMMEITYPRSFILTDGNIKFNLKSGDTNSYKFHIKGVNTSNPISIYDATNKFKITNYAIEGDTLSFTGRGNGNFEVNNKNITKKPFRTETRQVPDLVSPSNSADYILIYNKLFSSQSEQLRSHREAHDVMRAVKVSIDDIIDVFNYGIESPEAIRNFLTFAYSSWQQPHPSYVCLLGRGSLDPKNLITDPYYRNLIPVYGNPITDGYFVNSITGAFTYTRKLAIGRLPAYTQQEAQDMVTKIIAYDNNTPEPWWKNFIMITGGGTRNEQQQFQSEANLYLNSYILFPPISQEVSKIYRNDSAGYVTYNYRDSIRNEINRGGLIVNFIGHAASQDWEVGLEDPSTLSNIGKLPLVLSMTCFTGRNADANFRSFGEKFVYTPDKCAVGFIGSTGWSFSGPGSNYNEYMLQGYSTDSLRRIGDLLNYACSKLLPDSGTFAVKNTINCYNLLGDPATKLLLPSSPEFVIFQNDYFISNPYPSVNENINMKIYPKNLGTFADSCKYRFQILRNNQVLIQKDTVKYNFAFRDTCAFSFILDTIGNYSVKVILDPENHYHEKYEDNNVLTFQFPLKNISYLPLKPIDNSIVNENSVIITGLHPQINFNQNAVKIYLQVDTSSAFASPIYETVSNVTGGVATSFLYHLNFQDTSKVYFWRTNTSINGNFTGWTGYNRFIYRPSAKYMTDKSFIFTKDKAVYDSNITIRTDLEKQFNNFSSTNLFYNGNGFELKNFTGQLTVRSYGSNLFEASYFIINNFAIFIDGGNNPGLNIVKVKRLTGKYMEFRNFRVFTAQGNDSILNYLNTFDSTQYMMLGNASYTPALPLTQTVKNKIKEFGSIYADSVQSVGAFDTWAFIGYLGAPLSAVSEQYHNYSSNGIWTPSIASLTHVFLNTSGGFEFTIGPSHRWKNLSWDEFLYPQTFITFDVTGIKKNEDSTLLFSNAANPFINLDTVNSYIYPSLKIKANIKIDTISGIQSPIFKSMTLNYTPPAELVPDNNSFIKTDSIIQEGLPTTISVKYYNAGYVPANIIINKWTAVTYSGIKVLKIDTVYTPLLVDSSRVSVITFPTDGLKNKSKTIDTVDIFFESEIAGNNNDYYTFNNFALTNIVIAGDSLPPSIEVTYDGQKIMDGDLIASRPEIKFNFYDDSKLTYSLADTTDIFLKQDNKRIYFYENGSVNPLISFIPVNENDLKAVITYHPVLQEGPHSFVYFGKDKQGNSADSLTQNVFVSTAFAVRNLYNFPNPMKGETFFTFNLFYDRVPSICKIKIYTVAGRLIKEITAPANIGFNRIYWDGRDNDGESIANGIYLYKLVLQDADKTETSIQKLAVLK
jgi:hypothetical protein